MGKSQQWVEAATAIRTLLMDHYIYDGDVHVPTAVAAAGALAGECALMCVSSSLPEYGKVVSRDAEEMTLGEDPRVMSAGRYALAILTTGGVSEMRLPELASIRRRVDAVADGSTLPPPIVTPVCTALAWPMNAGPRHRREVFGLAHESGLSRVETVYALSMAMATMVRRVRRNIPVGVCTRMGLEAMLSATRRAPLMEVDISRDARAVDTARPVRTPEAEADRDWEQALGAAVIADNGRRASGFGRRMRA